MFDGIYKKQPPLPDSMWPAPAATRPLPRWKPTLPGRRAQLIFLGTVVVLGSLVVLLRPGPQEVSADAPASVASSTPQTPVAFATDVSSSLEPPTILDEPLPNSTAQTDVPTTAVSPELPTVRILNGSPQAGAASAAKATLESLGYRVLSIGDAQFDYVQTTLYYLEGNEDTADAVADALGEAAATTSENIIASPADILVVLGGEV